MIALKVSVNGEYACTAGTEDLAVLHSIINAVGALGADTTHKREKDGADLFLSVGGLTSRADGKDDHLRWIEHRILTIGDRIEIELVETSKADDPVSTTVHVSRKKQQSEQHADGDAEEAV